MGANAPFVSFLGGYYLLINLIQFNDDICYYQKQAIINRLGYPIKCTGNFVTYLSSSMAEEIRYIKINNF